MYMSQVADDFLKRLEALKTNPDPTNIDKLKTDLKEKFLRHRAHDNVWFDSECRVGNVDNLRDEIILQDCFVDSASALIQEVYDKAIQKGQIAISDRIETVVQREPWGWPISKITWTEWNKLSREEQSKLEEKVSEF